MNEMKVYMFGSERDETERGGLFEQCMRKGR